MTQEELDNLGRERKPRNTTDRRPTMSELKVYVKPIKTNMFGKTIVGQSYYLKSEADKVIAEKDKKIAELKDEIVKQEAENRWLKDENARLMSRPCYVCKEEQVKALENKFHELEGGTLILYNENNLRHNKYKRCLAMADMNWLQANRYSAAEMVERIRGNFEESTQCSKLEKKYLKRYNKWLALAEEPTWAKFLQLIHKEADK